MAKAHGDKQFHTILSVEFELVRDDPLAVVDKCLISITAGIFLIFCVVHYARITK